MFSHRFYKTFLCDTLTPGNLSNNNFTLLFLLMWSCSKDSTWYWSVTVYAKSKGGQSNTKKLYLQIRCWKFDEILVTSHFSHWGRRGCDCMVVGFTTTYAISAYDHWCEFESQSRRGVQHYVIKFFSDLR